MKNISQNLGMALLACLAAVYIGPKIFSTSDTIDFKYIWLAGEMWLAGEDPYSTLYAIKGEDLFKGYNRPAYWLYPPNWWPVSTLFSLPDYALAGTLWRVATAIGLFAGCLSVSRAVHSCVGPLPMWRYAVFGFCVATMSATAITLSLGQTSWLVFLGLCLFASAWLRRSVLIMTVALSLLALKPQIAVVAAGLLIPSLFWYRALFGSAVVVLAMALPSFLQDGLVEVLSGVLVSLSEWGKLDVNGPLELSGAGNLAYIFFGVTLGTTTSFALGIVTTCAIGLWVRNTTDANLRVTAVVGTLFATAVFVPLHIYDLMFVATFLVLCSKLPPVLQVLSYACVFVVWRANNLEKLSGLTPADTINGGGIFMCSVAVTVAGGFAIWSVFRTRRDATGG